MAAACAGRRGSGRASRPAWCARRAGVSSGRANADRPLDETRASPPSWRLPRSPGLSDAAGTGRAAAFLPSKATNSSAFLESPLPDSNRRPLPYHGSALPTELRGQFAGAPGVFNLPSAMCCVSATRFGTLRRSSYGAEGSATVSLASPRLHRWVDTLARREMFFAGRVAEARRWRARLTPGLDRCSGPGSAVTHQRRRRGCAGRDDWRKGVTTADLRALPAEDGDG
jgi:hypothetical protein